jgi:hypothetical protein
MTLTTTAPKVRDVFKLEVERELESERDAAFSDGSSRAFSDGAQRASAFSDGPPRAAAFSDGAGQPG